MIGQKRYAITEWDWLTLQLRLRAREQSAKLFVLRYAFPDRTEKPGSSRFPDVYVQCMFWCQTTEELLKKKAPRAEHLKFYVGWVRYEKACLSELVRTLPGLSKEIDLEKNIRFMVLHDYGGGSLVVCNFYGGEVIWDMGVDEVPE